MTDIAAAANSLGLDVADLDVNRSSIRHSRMSHRSRLAAVVKCAFENKTGKPEIVDRIPIYVSGGGGGDKLLCVPKLHDGCGKTVAMVVQHAIEDWQIANRIKSACFYTTPSNTGMYSGPCHLLEQLLDKSLLYPPHTGNIIGHAFDILFGSFTCPDTLLVISHVQEKKLPLLDVTKFKTGYQDKEKSHIPTQNRQLMEWSVLSV